jgi:hypothetical protein
MLYAPNILFYAPISLLKAPLSPSVLLLNYNFLLLVKKKVFSILKNYFGEKLHFSNTNYANI